MYFFDTFLDFVLFSGCHFSFDVRLDFGMDPTQRTKSPSSLHLVRYQIEFVLSLIELNLSLIRFDSLYLI